MDGSVELTVCDDADAVAQTAATDALDLLTQLQRERGGAGQVSLVITGGGVGIKVLAAMKEHPRLLDLDWTRVEVWWSDERHVAPDDDERNEKQARDALLDYLELTPELVHPAPWGPEMSAQVSAAALNAALLERDVPDLVLVGLGPDRHVCSLFPGFDVRLEDDRLALAVEGAPKPPPERISMTLPALRRSPEVWFVTAGTDKAEPVRDAIEADDVTAVPACGARGTKRTRFIVDTAAAANVTVS